jgi:hypothetical protein
MGCQKPAPANTFCLDFDEGTVAPSGPQQGGAFAFDETLRWSPPRSLAVSTNATPDMSKWAQLEHAIGGAPKTLAFDARINVGSFPETEIGEIDVRSAEFYYAVILVVEGTALTLHEGTWLSTSVVGEAKHPLGSIRVGEWARVTIELELADFSTTNARRKLVVRVDDQMKLTADGAAPGTPGILMPPQQTVCRFGITYASVDPTTPRKLNVDDVNVAWTF